MHPGNLDRSFGYLESLTRPDMSDDGSFAGPVTLGTEALYAKWVCTPEHSELLRREYVLLSCLDHPNWPRAHGFLRRTDGCSVLLMSANRGIEIAHLDTLQLPISVKVEIARQILSALQALHSIRFAHLDLKPEHVLVDLPDRADALPPHGNSASLIQVTLLDLNLATRFGEPVTSGNKGYLAPELAQGRQPATAAIDLYGFGILLFQLMTGERPFSGASFEAVIRNKLNAQLCEVEPEAYGGLSAILFSLLSARPDRRPDSAAEVWNQLRDIHIPTSPAARAARLTRSDLFPLVGRDTECSRFEAWLSGTPRTTESARCLLSGPAGIGKRRLQRHLLTIARSHGWNQVEDTEEPLNTGCSDPTSQLREYRLTRLSEQSEPAGPTLTLETAPPSAGSPDGDRTLHIALPPVDPDCLAEAVRTWFGTRSLQGRLSRVSLGIPAVLVSLLPQVPDSDDLGIDIDDVDREGTADLAFGFESGDPGDSLTVWFRDFLAGLESESRTALALIGLLPRNSPGADQEQLWTSTSTGTSTLSLALEPARLEGVVVGDTDSFALASKLWDQTARRELEESRNEFGQRALESGKLSPALQVEVALQIGSWDRLFEAWPIHARDLLDRYHYELYFHLFNKILGTVPDSHLGRLQTWATSFVESSLVNAIGRFHSRARDLVALNPEDPGLRLLNVRIAFHELRASPTEENGAAARRALDQISDLTPSDPGQDLDLSALAFGLRINIWGEFREFERTKVHVDSVLAGLPAGANATRARYLGLFLRMRRASSPWDNKPYLDQMRTCLDHATPWDRHIYSVGQALWFAARGMAEATDFLRQSVTLTESLRLGSFQNVLRQISSVIAFEHGSAEECRSHTLLTLRQSVSVPTPIVNLVYVFGNLTLVHLDLGGIKVAQNFLGLATRTQVTATSYSSDVLEFELVFAGTVGDDRYVFDRIEQCGRPSTLRPIGCIHESIALYRTGRQLESLELFEALIPRFEEREERDDLFNGAIELLQCVIDMEDASAARTLYERTAEFADAGTNRTRMFFDLAENDMIRRNWLTTDPTEAERRLLDNIIDLRRYHHRILEWRAHWNIATFYRNTGRAQEARSHRKEAHKQLEEILAGISDGRVFDCYRRLPAVVAFYAEAQAIGEDENS